MPNNVLLEPVQDDLPVRACGRWTAAKLDYVGRYVQAFEFAIRDKFRCRCYIDLFAGPGKNRTRETGNVLLGSPLRALTVQHPFTHYFFVDANPDNIVALRQRCAALPFNPQLMLLVGDSNQQVRAIVAAVRRLPSAIGLAFLDPQALELKWQTVAQLAQVTRMDLIIYYPHMALSRAMPKASDSPDTTAVDEFFGSRSWRQVFHGCRGAKRGLLHRELIDLYKDGLKKLGYTSVLQPGSAFSDEQVMHNSKNAALYRLLFASKDPLGHKLWLGVTRKDVNGQIRLFE